MADNFLSDDEVRARLTSGGESMPTTETQALSDDEVRAKLGGEQSGGSSLLRRGIADPLVGLAKGALVGIPEAGYGLANLATVGMVGRGVDALNKATGAPTASEGFRKANEFFDSMLSPETQAAKQRVNEAQGFIPTAAEYFKNPSTIVQGLAENAPGTLSMAGLGKAGLKVLGKGVLTGDALKEALTLAGGAESVAGKAILKENARRAALGAAIGESTYSAGKNVTGIMEVQGSDTMTPKQLALAAGSGFITGLISRMSGGLANRLKIADVDQLLQGSNMADLGSITKVVTAMLKSAIMEGAVEELPESAQEMYAMNLALGKEDPWEGVAEASASGWVIGSAMGVGGVAGAKLRMAIHKADPNQQEISKQQQALSKELEAIGGEDNGVQSLQEMPIPEQYKQLTMGPQGELYNAQRQRNLESAQGFSMVGGVNQGQPLSDEAQRLNNYLGAINTGMYAPQSMIPQKEMPVAPSNNLFPVGPQGELELYNQRLDKEAPQGFTMVGGVDQSQPLSLEAQQLRNYENAVNTGMAAPVPQTNQPQYTTNEDGSIRITTAPTHAPVQESTTPTGQQAITDYFGENKSGLNIKEAHNPNGSFVYLGKGLGTDIEGTTIPYTEEEHKQYRKLEAQLKGGLITQKQFSEQTRALSEGVLKRGVETTTETPSPITTTPEGTMRVTTPKSQAVPHPSEFNTFNEYATALGYNAPPDMPIGEFAKTNAAQMAQNNTNASELTGKWNNRGTAEVNKETPTTQKLNELAQKDIYKMSKEELIDYRDTIKKRKEELKQTQQQTQQVDELEQKAIQFGTKPANVLSRLKEAVSVMKGSSLKDWTYDAENKRMVNKDGKTILQWQTREKPNEPQSYRNQQTSVGTVVLKEQTQPTQGVQDLKGNGQYTAPAFPNRSFNIVKGGKGEGWIIQEAYTGLPLPRSNARKDILKTKQEAIDHINDNFGLTPSQIKHNLSDSGTLSDKSVLWNKQRVEQQQKSGVQDEEITQITSDIGQNRGRELPAGTISRSNPMPNDTATINARTVIGKIAKAFGKSVVWVDINDENEIKFNGLVTSNLPNRIIINAKSKTPHLIILGHEIFHEMKRESPELYQQFKDYVVQNTINTPKFKQLLNDVYKKNNLIKGDVNTDLMFEELASEFAGEQFISREFWENMAKTNPTLFEKVIDIARKMINQAVKALGANKNVVGEQYFKDVQTARKMLADVMGEYSKGKLKGEGGEGVKYSAIPYIDDIIDSFTNHTPKTISPEIVSKFRNSFEVAKDDFKPHQEYFSLPWWNAKKDKMWELAFKIFGIDRIERRSQLKADFAKIAEPFFEYQKTMKQAGKTSTQIKEGQRLISRALISGDALLGQELNDLKEQLGAYQKGSPEYNKIAERIDQIQTLNRYSDEELTNGFVDEYGNTIKLQQEEIKAYKSVRAALDNMFTKYVDHLAKQDFRQYRRQKWYSLLVSAAGFDLNKSQTETILGEGLKKAALLRSRKVQVNVQTVFDEINGGIEKGAIEQEALKAGKIYSKIAEKMGKEIGKLEEAVAYVTNETDKAKVRKDTEELLNAYIMTRPSMKKIKDLRNDYKKSVAYFPRVRPEGKMKIKLVKDIYNKEGQKIDEREIDMQMFDNQHQGMKIMQSMIDKHGKNGNLPEGVHFTDVERTVKTPEFAFQGVNDINMQKVLDSAIQGIELKEKVFDENGNAIDVQELLRDMGYQAIAAQFQSRGFARRGIHRNPDLVKGYQEEDLQQVLKDYISGMSGIMTKQEAAADFLDLMKEVSKEGKPEKFRALATYGKNQLRNDTKADRFSSKIRAFMFTYYLAGVVRMVAAQLSQNYTTAIPDEAEYLRNIGQGGLGKAEKDYHIAMKDVIANKWGVKEATNEIETRMLTQMMDTGITQDQYVRQLFGHMQNEFRNKWNKTLDVFAIPMSGMEIFNRKSAALTRFRHAYPEAMKKVGTVVEGEQFTEEDAYNEAFDEARNAVNSTHFAMSKANLPLWAQGEGFGVVAKTLMTFKTFPQNYLLFMADANWKTRLHSLAYVGAFGGLMGLPFMKDLFDWVEKEFGLNFNRSIRQTLRGVGGKHLEDLGVNGIPAMLGANLSASLAIGLPFTESAEQTIGGVYAGQYQKMKRAYQALKRNDYARAAQNIFPEFARAPLMAIEQSQFGKDVFGRPGMAVSPTGEPILNAQGKPLSMTNSQAAIKALGFNPTDYGREQEMNQIVKRQTKWVTEKKANIAQTLKFDRLNNEPDALTNAKKATEELKQDIKSRGIQDLVPHFTFTDIVKASKKKPGAKERREARYKREELS